MSDDTVVDLYSLDTEWARQGSLRKNAGDDQAEVADIIRDKKSYLKYRTAQISLEYSTGVRQIVDAEGKPIAKPTVGALKSAVECDEEIYALEKEINALQKKLDICTNYTTAIDHKKYALQDSVKLFLAGYFSDPVDKSEGGEEYIKKAEETKAKMDASEKRTELKERRRRRKESEV